MKKSLFAVLILLLVAGMAYAGDDDFADDFGDEEVAASTGFEFTGFLELEQGMNITGTGPHRTATNPQDFVMANRRFRLDTSRMGEKGSVYAKIDFIRDDIAKRTELDIRELRLQYRAASWLDLSVGKQVSTWGVGDMLFINDLFPKNWIANFLGRDMEEMKDSSLSARATSYFAGFTFDVVYTPQFAPDTTPTGCYLSTYDPNSGKPVANTTCPEESGADRVTNSHSDGEIAAALKHKLLDQELALYYYQGFHKSPKGLVGTPGSLVAHYPRLTVLGASSEGQVGPGILTAEVGEYISHEDEKGTNPMIENSLLKYLVGYKVDLSANWSTGVQWYQEKMHNYSHYRTNATTIYMKKEYQNTFTLRVGFVAQQDTLFSNVFVYYRPQDKDSFIKYDISKRLDNNFVVSAGVNIFTGKENYLDREFGMLKDDDNFFVRFIYNI